VRYALVCNEHGGVLDDVLVSHLQTPAGRRFHLLVVNASNRAKIVQWITPRLVDFPTVTMSDRTTLTAMIAVQGPHVIAVCSRLFKTDIQRLRYYRGTITEQFGKPVIVTRTGYTGEDGLELIVRADDARRVWENLLLAGRDAGFVAAGLGARDTLRLEAGMPLYGHELSESINPLEAGLGFACTLAGRSFIGDAALREVQAAGPAKVRVGLLLGGRRPAREGAPIVDASGAAIGQVTSGSPSPTLGRPIAMGYVPPRYSALGSEVQIDIRGRLEPATVASMPFYRKL
jgi:aminomethyltransferase